MATQIENKIQKLRSENFDFGAQLSEEIDCGYGGRLQKFTNASLYYHPVMGPEAREVHGAIGAKYFALGGHDVNPANGVRMMGFPVTDEINSKDGRCRVSRFEWGSIYWTLGGTYVYGEIYKEYIKAGGEAGRLGYPIADPVKLSDGLAVFFEYGCMYVGKKGFGKVIEMTYTFPQLGHPRMIARNEMHQKEVIEFTFPKEFLNENIGGHLLEELFNGRIFIRETGRTPEIPLNFKFEDCKKIQTSMALNTYKSAIHLSDVSAVKERTLYDIILKFPNRIHSIAPHSVYIKQSWTAFKFIHATDLHISRRLDAFRKFFNDKSMIDAVARFNNFNDNFREFIRYANRLHDQGNLDFVMITGDLVDYIFEDGGKFYHNNNFVYFENIVRGLTGKPDQVENHELRVPIFTTLGNHDYRTRPYYPLFGVDIQWPVPNKTLEQFGSFNITRDEAKIVTEELLNVTEKVSSETAVDMIKPDRENRGGNLNHYFRSICRESSYTVKLGAHQVVMIDGKWDDGTIEGTWDALSYFFGFKGESTDNFVDGSPDSVGFTPLEFQMISRALQDPGLVIIGVHAPVLNPMQSEYNWFFRESVRAGNPYAVTMKVHRYLFRQSPMLFVNPLSDNSFEIDLQKRISSGWITGNATYFHQGTGDELLDYAIMRGSREEFLKLITGSSIQSATC